MAGFWPPSSSLFFSPPSFSFHLWVFCLHVHRVEGKGTKTEMAAAGRGGRSGRLSDPGINESTCNSYGMNREGSMGLEEMQEWMRT